MIIAKCDKCGKVSNDANDVERIYLYENEFDLCEECMKIYEKVEKEMSDMAIKKRAECEETIKKETMEIMKKFEIKVKEGKE